MEDEVDRLVRGWRRALPAVDVSPLEVLSRVSRLARHLDRQRTVVLARHDLEIWSFDVLSALRRAEPPHLSPGQLLAQTLVSSGTMTNRLDKLEGAGLVQRHADPDDRRGVIVELTSQGRAALDRYIEVQAKRERQLMSSMSEEDKKELANLLRRLLNALESESSVVRR